MSYILEALKKADAERERGVVPDLHAQPVPLAAAYAAPASGGGKPWLWLMAGAAVTLAVVLLWRFSDGDAPPIAVTAPPIAPATPPAAPPTPPATTVVPQPPPAQAAAEPSPVPAPAQRAEKPATPRAPAVATPTRARPEQRRPSATASAVAADARAAPPSAAAKVEKPAAAASAPRAPLLATLPDDIRRQVPAMTIGGSVYSQQPANRMVIINGQVFREGSAVTPDLLLEQIGPKSAVFSLRGQRFEMPF